jgi:hypothetical protein
MENHVNNEGNFTEAQEQASTNGEVAGSTEVAGIAENGLLSDGESSSPGDDNSEDNL